MFANLVQSRTEADHHREELLAEAEQFRLARQARSARRDDHHRGAPLRDERKEDENGR